MQPKVRAMSCQMMGDHHRLMRSNQILSCLCRSRLHSLDGRGRFALVMKSAESAVFLYAFVSLIVMMMGMGLLMMMMASLPMLEVMMNVPSAQMTS
jgi:hypothetical protein